MKALNAHVQIKPATPPRAPEDREDERAGISETGSGLSYIAVKKPVPATQIKASEKTAFESLSFLIFFEALAE